LADDLGGRDLGCYGSTFYETPSLDRLAREGMLFTDAYAACCVCSPTRASIMTGKYPPRVGITDWIPGIKVSPSQKLKRPVFLHHLPLPEVTIAEALKDAQYQTCFIGKWHLGGPKFFPDKQGFDINIGGCEYGHPPSYFSPYHIPTLTDGPKGEYLTDRLTDEALKFLDSAKKDRPFLLYLSHYAVHIPQQAKPELIKKYEAKAAKLPKTGAPEFLPEGEYKTRQIQNQPIYAAMIQSLDESVGRVMQKLAELHLETNTIVFFTSDNGGLSTKQGWPTSNSPLRAGKGWPYEGGVREPLLVRWPGVTQPGSTCHEPVISPDFYPTLLQMAGLPLRPKQHVDGRSFCALLEGKSLPERPIFWHYPHYAGQGGRPCGTIRLGNLKLIEWYEDMNVEMYDLSADIGEKHDLASQFPQKAAELTRRLHEWRKEVGANMPTKNPDYRASAK
ncbi:MAG TPA: sulfatase, partial [Verrucomicrobiae bacterium]|nr:sulfatase [Verrucomicrobiae bacterium]